MPARRQSTARIAIAASEKRSTSCALATAASRGRPRKVKPNARTKQAPASAAASAKSAPTAGIMSFSPHCGICGLSSTAWKVSHSETKPLNGRQRGDRDRADKEGKARHRHGVDEPAEPLEVARTRSR